MIVPLRKAFDYYEKLRLNEERPLQRKETDRPRRSTSRKTSRRRTQIYGRKSKQQNFHLQESNRKNVQEENELNSQVDEKLKSTSDNEAKCEKKNEIEKPNDPVGEKEIESRSQKNQNDQQETKKEKEKDSHTLDCQHGVEELENEREAAIDPDKIEEHNSDGHQDVKDEEEKVTEGQKNLEIEIETDEHYNKNADGEPYFEEEVDKNHNEQERTNSDRKSEVKNHVHTEAGNQKRPTIDVKEAKQLHGEMNQSSEKDGIKGEDNGQQDEETQVQFILTFACTLHTICKI